MNKLLIVCLASIVIVFNSCKRDPCDKIICKNGGVCVNGSCSCPLGYMGSDCGTQRTPTSMTITDVFVENFPPTDAGAGWDLTSGAELYVVVYKGTNVLFNSPSYYNNATNGTSYEFTPSSPINVLYPSDNYTIELWDYDTPDPDDFMGGITFTPYYSSTNGFPSQIEYTAGQIKVKLSVTYTW